MASTPSWVVVARREFLERVRTVWFAIVTVLGPLGMIALIVVPAWLGVRSAEEKVVIQVVDRTGRNLFPAVTRAAALAGARLDLESVSPRIEEDVLLARIRDEKINGFLLLPEALLDGESAIYRGDNATNFRIQLHLTQALNAAAMEVRAADAGIDFESIVRLTSPKVSVIARHDTGQGEASSAEASFIVGYAVMFILYMSILLYAVNVMRSVVQEKTSRVVEIVVSATRPRSLMLGKVIGVGGVGLLQLGIWFLMALALLTYREEVLGLFGIQGAGDIELPALDAVDVAIILAYFALGYFFYAALYAAIGAMVNSDQEAQQAQTPVVLLLILPVVMVQLVANDPRSGLSQALTQIPFSSPVLMPMRFLLDGASWVEVAVSLAVLATSTLGAVALAGRIYRVGILMYGKRPSVRELARWIRYS